MTEVWTEPFHRKLVAGGESPGVAEFSAGSELPRQDSVL